MCHFTISVQVITRHQQWTEHVSNDALLRDFEMTDALRVGMNYITVNKEGYTIIIIAN